MVEWLAGPEADVLTGAMNTIDLSLGLERISRLVRILPRFCAGGLMDSNMGAIRRDFFRQKQGTDKGSQ